MASIEIVVHCFSEFLHQYRVLLSLQLESLIRSSQGSVKTSITVVTGTHDIPVFGTVSAYLRRLEASGIDVTVIALGKDRLYRRAIGRNIAALATHADVVWFADCDYWFGDGCLEAVTNLVKVDSTRVFTPGQYECQNFHTEGDRIVRKFKDGQSTEEFVLDRDLFFTRGNRIAIGGLQIIGGDLARQMGYLNKTPWADPLLPSQFKSARSTRDDVAFRKHTSTRRSKKISVPNLFRFRHTEAGRDEQ